MKEDENLELKNILSAMLCTVFKNEIASIAINFFNIADEMNALMTERGIPCNGEIDNALAEAIALILTNGMGSKLVEMKK